MSKKITAFLIIGIMLIISLSLGISYASYQFDKEQNSLNDITFGCFNLDVTQQINPATNNLYDINLENTYPMSDVKGITNDPHVVTITNNCTSNNYIEETILAVNVLKNNTIPENYIRYATQINNNTVSEAHTLGEITNLSDIEANDVETDKSYIIRTTQVSNGTPQTIKVWFWIDEDAPNSIQGSEFLAKFKIYTKVVEEQFETTPNAPELYYGMIPVKFDSNGNTIFADITKDWYSYENNEWANAVLIDKTVLNQYYHNGSIITRNGSDADNVIPEEYILQYYVWIPRYAYKLFNTEVNGAANKQMIDIKFQNKNEKLLGDSNGAYLTHPAFTYDNKELSGIWVGKYELSATNISTTGNYVNCVDYNCNLSDKMRILPNKPAMTYHNIRVFNQAIVSMSRNNNGFSLNHNEVDTHGIKNTEWGAVAYLSESKYGIYKADGTCANPNQTSSLGCEIFINNVNTGHGTNDEIEGLWSNGPTITGCSGNISKAAIINLSDMSNTAACPTGYSWKENGVLASTTGNMYGIYDMVGGSDEITFSNLSRNPKTFSFTNSGNLFYSYQLDEKYYDKYLNRRILGDATEETLRQPANSYTGGWNMSAANKITTARPYFTRGGNYKSGSSVGIYAYNGSTGLAYSYVSTRAVLVSILDI